MAVVDWSVDWAHACVGCQPGLRTSPVEREKALAMASYSCLTFVKSRICFVGDPWASWQWKTMSKASAACCVPEGALGKGASLGIFWRAAAGGGGGGNKRSAALHGDGKGCGVWHERAFKGKKKNKEKGNRT